MERSQRKSRTGTVISDKTNKTRIVRVVRDFRAPVYEKVLSKSKKLYVHDEENVSHVGDIVKVMESRPLSKLKRWTLEAVVKKAQ
jgi:small subunit ribosomal protein S17